MSITLNFIHLIIPISKIDACYHGGFKAFKTEREEEFIGYRYAHDGLLFSDSVMGFDSLDSIIEEWEQRGLVIVAGEGKQKHWVDICIQEPFLESTLPCDWLYHDKERTVYYIDPVTHEIVDLPVNE